MNFLIVDLNITLNGHKLGFIQEMVNYLVLHHAESEHQFHFLVNEQVEVAKSNCIHIHLAEYSYSEKFKTLKGLKKYSEQWKYIKLKSVQNDIEKVVLMEFDLYQAAIGQDKATDFDISGIWFRPYFRQTSVGLSFINKILFSFKKLQKKILLKTALRNKQLKRIMILNDQLTVDALNEATESKRFDYLADPVFDYPCYKLENIREKYEIEEDKIIFLIFGYIDDRKNVTNILKAIELLPKNIQKQISLLVIGKTAESYTETLKKAIIHYTSESQLIVRDDFVDNCEMEALFAQTDLVLRMNVNYFASSGIIGLSAKHNKPSIVSDYGILADLTEQYELGRLADPLNPTRISELMKDFVKNRGNWKIDGSAYYKEHNTEAYVEGLLKL